MGIAAERPLGIYLAGKISAHDWRQTIVVGGEDRPALDGDGWWAPKEGAIGVHTYTGPFFMGDNHGIWSKCRGEANDHGAPAGDHGDPGHEIVAELCRDSLAVSDLVFAWLDDPTAYGTLVEIGFAKARGCFVVVAAPAHLADLWFAQCTADMLIEAETPKNALEMVLEAIIPPTDLSESPAEKAMFAGFIAAGVKGFTQQHRVDQYRLDFAFVERRIAIEVDGFRWHDRTPEQAERDKRRDRHLQMAGWRVFRFAAREVFRDAIECAHQVAKMVAQ